MCDSPAPPGGASARAAGALRASRRARAVPLASRMSLLFCFRVRRDNMARRFKVQAPRRDDRARTQRRSRSCSAASLFALPATRPSTEGHVHVGRSQRGDVYNENTAAVTARVSSVSVRVTEKTLANRALQKRSLSPRLLRVAVPIPPFL